jgi:hypothetical protein
MGTVAHHGYDDFDANRRYRYSWREVVPEMVPEMEAPLLGLKRYTDSRKAQKLLGLVTELTEELDTNWRYSEPELDHELEEALLELDRLDLDQEPGESLPEPKRSIDLRKAQRLLGLRTDVDVDSRHSWELDPNAELERPLLEHERSADTSKAQRLLGLMPCQRGVENARSRAPSRAEERTESESEERQPQLHVVKEEVIWRAHGRSATAQGWNSPSAWNVQREDGIRSRIASSLGMRNEEMGIRHERSATAQGWISPDSWNVQKDDGIRSRIASSMGMRRNAAVNFSRPMSQFSPNIGLSDEYWEPSPSIQMHEERNQRNLTLNTQWISREDLGVPMTPSQVGSKAQAEPIFGRAPSQSFHFVRNSQDGMSHLTRPARSKRWASLPTCLMRIGKKRSSEPDSLPTVRRVNFRECSVQHGSLPLTEDNLRQYEDQVGWVPKPINPDILPKVLDSEVLLKPMMRDLQPKYVKNELLPRSLNSDESPQPLDRNLFPTLLIPDLSPDSVDGDSQPEFLVSDALSNTQDQDSFLNLEDDDDGLPQLPTPIVSPFNVSVTSPRFPRFSKEILDKRLPTPPPSSSSSSSTYSTHSTPVPDEPPSDSTPELYELPSSSPTTLDPPDTTPYPPLQLFTCAICQESKSSLSFPVRQCSTKCTHPPHACAVCVQEWIGECVDVTGWDQCVCPECGVDMEYEDVEFFAAEDVWRRYAYLYLCHVLEG